MKRPASLSVPASTPVEHPVLRDDEDNLIDVDYEHCDDCGALHNESYCPICEEMG